MVQVKFIKYYCNECENEINFGHILTSNNSTLDQAYCKNCGIVEYNIKKYSQIPDWRCSSNNTYTVDITDTDINYTYY